jgi:hypothetical protein
VVSFTFWPLYFRGKFPGTNYIKDLVEHRIGLDVVANAESRVRARNPMQVIQTLVCYFTFNLNSLLMMIFSITTKRGLYGSLGSCNGMHKESG